MLYIFSNKIPTGGPETMHQFASCLKRQGVDVFMVYFDSNTIEIPKKLQDYGVPVAEEIIDIKENLMIVPEAYTQYLYDYKNIRKCIWWLSRDFYYGYNNLKGLVYRAQRKKIKRLLFPVCIPLMYIKHKIVRSYFKFGKDKNEIFHLYNCEYVRQYLIQKGVHANNMMYMCGPIRKEYFECVAEKKELLLTYNPKKNFEFTQKILNELRRKRPDIKTIGISGMNSGEIVQLLLKCSVYIDFGQFPGPERIPREAVLCGCNIITSKYGSAGNNIDVLVPSKYKFDAKIKNISQIVEAIEELVDNYSKHTGEYDKYREKVQKQKDVFRENANIFINRFDLIKTEEMYNIVGEN